MDTSDAIRRADALAAMGRWPQMLEELAPLLAGADAPALCRASRALILLGRNEEALAMAERAIAAAPDHEWPHRLRSRALMEASRKVKGSRKDELLRQAVASIREAVRLSPRSAVVRLSAAEVWLAAGELQPAARAAAEAQRLDPGEAEGWAVDARVALAADRPERAERSARRALQLEPNNAVVWNNLGVAMQRQGRWQEATAAYLQSARLDPSNATARRNVSRAGEMVLRMFALLVLLPLLLLPYGSVLYVAVYAAGYYLGRPSGALRRRTEAAAIRVAMRLERLPLRRKVSQSFGLHVSHRLVIFAVILAFLVMTYGTPAGVTFLALLAFIVLEALRTVTVDLRRRSRRGARRRASHAVSI